MKKKIVVGSQVEILAARYMGRHGIVTEIFQAEKNNSETTYKVRYSLDGCQKMFKQHELKLVWEK